MLDSYEPDIALNVERLPAGLWFSATRDQRTVAPRLAIASETGDLPLHARAQVVAQALGVAAGVLLREPGDKRRPGIMTPLPADAGTLCALSARTFEFKALIYRLELHHRERLRLQRPRTSEGYLV